MKYTQFLAAAAMAAVANAHATIHRISINDVSAGVGNVGGGYIRSPPNNSPVKDLASKDLTCNVNGGTAAGKTLTVTAGSKITVQWFHNGDSPSDQIIDPSHQGPVLVYIAPTASNGAGPVWVKLAEDGYSGGKWAVQRLIDARGQHSFVLPAALADGEYLIRPEIIAHHESYATFNNDASKGAQFYMECIQIKVTSGGGTKLPTGVSIPGVYTYSDPGVAFDIYGGFSSYKIPGPAVWKPVAGAPAPVPTTTLQTTTRPAVPTTTSKAPVVVVPSPTKAPVVVVPTTTKAPVVPTTTPSKVACPAPETVLITVVAPVPTPTGGPAASKWGQCGGIGFSGPKTCAAGSTCTKQNDWYSQCL